MLTRRRRNLHTFPLWTVFLCMNSFITVPGDRSSREGQHSALGSLQIHFRGPNDSFSWCFQITHLKPIIIYLLFSLAALESLLALFIGLQWYQQEDPISLQKSNHSSFSALRIVFEQLYSLSTVGMLVRKRTTYSLAETILKRTIRPLPFTECNLQNR